MEKLILEVQEINKCPKLYLNRAIDITDLQNVDERPNILIFLMEDDKGWTFLGKVAVLKVRFYLAEEIKEQLNNYLEDATIKGYALDLFKVHRFEVTKKEATPEKEIELKLKVKKLIESSIQKINLKADLSF